MNNYHRDPIRTHLRPKLQGGWWVGESYGHVTRLPRGFPVGARGQVGALGERRRTLVFGPSDSASGLAAVADARRLLHVGSRAN